MKHYTVINNFKPVLFKIELQLNSFAILVFEQPQ